MKEFAIKYTEDFTEDIFDHLVKWCNENIVKKDVKWYDSFENNHRNFKNKEYFRFANTTIGVDNNPQGAPEITLQELCEMIGYTKKMTDDELIEEAKKRYPKGTHYIPTSRSNNNTDISCGKFVIGTDGRIEDKNLSTGIYDSGKWAKIILKPEEKSEVIDTPKFEVGKWYKNPGTFKGAEITWGKFLKHVDNYWYYSEIIDGGKYKLKEGNWYYTLKKVYPPLTDLSEIQEYLPLDHPDRIIVKTEESVPEYVECIKNSFRDFTVGKVYKYPQPTDDTGHKRVNITGWGSAVQEAFKPLTEAAYLAQNNVKAELTELPEKWYIKTTHDCNTVVCDWFDEQDENNTDRTIGNYYCSNNGDLTGWMYHATDRIVGYTEISFDQFKQWVLKENVTLEDSKKVDGIFKVGDIVVIGDNNECSVNQTGDVGKITEVKAIDCRVDCGKGTIGNYHGYENIRKATQEEINAYLSKQNVQLKTVKQNDVKEIIPEKNKWYEIEYGYFNDTYIVRYDGNSWEKCEWIDKTGYTPSDDSSSYFNKGTLKIIRELKSDDPVITEPLLKYAKSKYPVGCRVESPDVRGNFYTIEDIHFPFRISAQFIQTAGKQFNIYGAFGTWASIVSLPEEKVVTEYPLDKYEVGVDPVESNLDKANRMFKVGMKVKDDFGNEGILNSHSFPLYDNSLGIYTNDRKIELYYKRIDKWATIESTPQGEPWFTKDPWTTKVSSLSDWQKATIEYDEPIEWKTQSRKVSSSDLIDVEIVVPITIGS